VAFVVSTGFDFFFCGFFQFEIAELHTGRYLVLAIAGRWLLGGRPQYLSVDIVRSTCMRVILRTRAAAAAGSAWGAFAVHHLRIVVVGLGTSCFGHLSLIGTVTARLTAGRAS